MARKMRRGFEILPASLNATPVPPVGNPVTGFRPPRAGETGIRYRT